MCSATLGATPVKACTCAASASFSYGSRGTPACAKTLKRVPEFPYAHDGVSIACARNRDLIAPMSVTTNTFQSVQVEDLGERPHPRVGGAAVQVFEEGRHLRLPAGVDVRLVHRAEGGLEVVCLQIADQQAVLAQE